MRVLRFGVFELDLERHELRKAGRRVPLQQQPWKALALLASRPGRLVAREEIRQVLWPDGTHVDFDRGINFCLNQVRSALGDPARSAHFIETVPRLGYRFVADVHGLEPEPPGASSLAASPPAAMPRRQPWLAVACVLGLAAASGDDRHRGATPPRGATSPAAGLARAGAQAALARMLLGQNESGLRLSAETMPRARAAALAALREDPQSADARVSLALVKLHYDWDGDAGDDIERALALAPGLARAHLARAAYLAVRGEHDAALLAALRAAELDPVCPTVRGDLASYYYAAHRYSEAAEQWRLSVAIQGDGGPRDRLVDALRHQGRMDEAWREAEAVMRHAGVPAAAASDLALRGAESALRAYLSGSADFLGGRGASPVRLAALRAAAGEDERALGLLERAANERSWGLLGALAADPDLARLEGRPRYERLLRQTGLRPPLLALVDPPALPHPPW